MNVLLIGGPRDGMRCEVKDGVKSIEFPEMSASNWVFSDANIAPQPTNIRIHEYRLQPIYTQGGRLAGVFQYVGDNMPAVIRLVDGYQGAQS